LSPLKLHWQWIALSPLQLQSLEHWRQPPQTQILAPMSMLAAHFTM